MDPINYLVSPDMAANTEMMEALREHYGLNDPAYVQYFRWLQMCIRDRYTAHPPDRPRACSP